MKNDKKRLENKTRNTFLILPPQFFYLDLLSIFVFALSLSIYYVCLCARFFLSLLEMERFVIQLHRLIRKLFIQVLYAMCLRLSAFDWLSLYDILISVVHKCDCVFAKTALKSIGVFVAFFFSNGIILQSCSICIAKCSISYIYVDVLGFYYLINVWIF